MIRHVVMWELRDAADASRFAGALRECAGLVPEMRGYAVSTRGDGLAGSCDVALVADFDDRAALQAYLDHPRHREVSAALAPLRRARHLLDAELQSAS